MNHKPSWSFGATRLIDEPILFNLALLASIAQLLDLWTTSRFPLELEANIYIRALIDEHGWSDPMAWLAIVAIKLCKVALIWSVYSLAVKRRRKGNYISMIALGFEGDIKTTRISYKQALARLMLGYGKVQKGRWLDLLATIAPVYLFSIWICSTYHAAWGNYWGVEGRWDLVAKESVLWPSLMEWLLIIPLAITIIMALTRRHNNLATRATQI